MENLVVTTYIIYLPIAIVLTLLVARLFFKNSKIFMLDIFSGRNDLAMSTNKLFEMGFYLLNLGFALFYMKIVRYTTGFNHQDMFEILSHKVGMLSVFLGVMVFFNLYMLFRGKKKTTINKMRREQVQTAAARPELKEPNKQ